MELLWRCFVEPICNIIKPEVLVSIGPISEVDMRLPLDYCAEEEVELHVFHPDLPDNLLRCIDDFDLDFESHENLTAANIKELGFPETYLYHGESSWTAVHSFLTLLKQTYSKSRKPFPTIFIRETGWPYGQRDRYNDENAGNLHPSTTEGLLPARTESVSTGGLFSGQLHAKVEGGEKNGVQTAIDDFMRSSRMRLDYFAVNGMHGLGVLLPSGLVEKKRPIKNFVRSLKSQGVLLHFIEGVEEERVTLRNLRDEAQATLRNVRSEFWSKTKVFEEEKRELAAKIADVTTQVEAAEKANKSLSSQLESQKEIASCNQTESNSNESIELRASLQDALTENDRLKAEVSSLRSQLLEQSTHESSNVVELNPAGTKPVPVEKYDSMQQELMFLRRTRGDLRTQLAQVNNNLADLRGDFTLLQQWLAQSQLHISEWQKSTRWKVGDTIGTVYRRITSGEAKEQPCDQLTKIFEDFSAWNHHYIAIEDSPRRTPRSSYAELVSQYRKGTPPSEKEIARVAGSEEIYSHEDIDDDYSSEVE